MTNEKTIAYYTAYRIHLPLLSLTHLDVYKRQPNIYPQAEYETRKNEAIRFVTSKNIDFIDADYDYAHWLHTMQGLEHEPERGSRCLKCFTLRLTETARYASCLLYTSPRHTREYDLALPT